MPAVRFADFEAEARAQGYDGILQRRWPPLTVLDAVLRPGGFDNRG